MDISLLLPTVMSILSPLLTKAGEKAAETIGEKVANNVLEKNLWQKVKSLFIKDAQTNEIDIIENKNIATSEDIAKIENKVYKAIQIDNQFATELSKILNLSYVDEVVVEQLVRSIQSDKNKIKEYYEDRQLARVETEGSYEIMIKRTRRRIEKDEKELVNILANARK